MGSLMTSLLHSADAMRVFDRQLATVQNNITNSSTPGYVRQTQTVQTLPFQLDTGFTGGILPGPVVSARDEYAEEGVRRQQSQLGLADQKATDLARVESIFDLASPYAIPGALSGLFRSFGQLSINPNDQAARQTVIDSASRLAASFNQASLDLTEAGREADQQTRIAVDAINRLAGRIRDLNEQRRQNYTRNSDAGLDASAHATLEELAQYGNFTVLQQADGTMTLYLGGQVPLVVGDHLYEIQADFSSATTRIVDLSGTDVSRQIQSGKLAALLEEKNTLVPSYLNDLNKLARAVADEVNLQLASGVDRSGAAPAIDLFSYNSALGEAATLSLTAITPGQIAAAHSGAPGGNANALDLAAMLDARLVDGFTFTQFFGNLGAKAGRDLANARQEKDIQASLLAQAHSLRDQVSAVDINEEAARLMQIQRAYQAAGQFLSVLNQITETVIGLIR